MQDDVCESGYFAIESHSHAYSKKEKGIKKARNRRSILPLLVYLGFRIAQKKFTSPALGALLVSILPSHLINTVCSETPIINKANVLFNWVDYNFGFSPKSDPMPITINRITRLVSEKIFFSKTERILVQKVHIRRYMQSARTCR
jgi:hypothetical protein